MWYYSSLPSVGKPLVVVVTVQGAPGLVDLITACNSGSAIRKESKMTLISVKIFFRVLS